MLIENLSIENGFVTQSAIASDSLNLLHTTFMNMSLLKPSLFFMIALDCIYLYGS